MQLCASLINCHEDNFILIIITQAFKYESLFSLVVIEIALRFFNCLLIFSDLYDFCIKEKIADGSLIAKWKKQGYENLCCLRCIQTRDTNFATNCICRVPKTKLEEGKIVECVHCGCRGCSG